MRTTLTLLVGWTFIAVVLAALFVFVRSDSAVRRLDALERTHPVWTWLAMLAVLLTAAIALVCINTDATSVLRGA